MFHAVVSRLLSCLFTVSLTVVLLITGLGALMKSGICPDCCCEQHLTLLQPVRATSYLYINRVLLYVYTSLYIMCSLTLTTLINYAINGTHTTFIVVKFALPINF